MTDLNDSFTLTSIMNKCKSMNRCRESLGIVKHDTDTRYLPIQITLNRVKIHRIP